MARTMHVAALQTSYGEDMGANIAKTERFIREAAKRGAQVILPSELFQGPYFCTTQEERWFKTAYPADAHPVRAGAGAAGEGTGRRYSRLDLRARRAALLQLRRHRWMRTAKRSACIARAISLMGPAIRRNTISAPAIPASGSGTPGTAASASASAGTSGFPEAARAMALMGAEVLFYPTAIGSEPHDASLDTRDPWRRAMQGHAVSNIVPVVAANRIGTESQRRRTSTARPSSPIIAAIWSANSAAPRRGSSITCSISTSSTATAPPGASSATAGRSFTSSFRRPLAKQDTRGCACSPVSPCWREDGRERSDETGLGCSGDAAGAGGLRAA